MTRPVCVSDALDLLAQRTGIQHGEVGVANTVVLGYVHELEHRIAAVQADAALVQWARQDMAAVAALRAAVGAALDEACLGQPDALAAFLRAVHDVLEVRP